MIIIALLVVALYFLMNRKPCNCPMSASRPGQGFNLERFENVGTSDVPVIGAGWIRNRRENGGSLGLVNKDSPTSWIRTEGVPQGLEFAAARVQSRNHNMYQSQYVKHHLKADHRGKMMQNMMGESTQDSAGVY